jgi:hypothetical protein
MKMIRVNYKQDFGVGTNFYNTHEFKKIEYSQKVNLIKLSIGNDIFEGEIENFNMEKFEKFIVSDDRNIFEFCIN